MIFCCNVLTKVSFWRKVEPQNTIETKKKTVLPNPLLAQTQPYPKAQRYYELCIGKSLLFQENV